MAIKIPLGGIKWHFFVSVMNSTREADKPVPYKTSCRSTGEWLAEDCTMHPLTCMAVIICHRGISTFSSEGAGQGQPIVKKSHACDLLYSLLLLLILLYCLFVMGQNTPSKLECQYIGHCSNTKSKQLSLHGRVCDQNSQGKVWKHREYLKSRVISFFFVLSKRSFSLAAQIFPPTSLNNLVFRESWNYHVLASKERPFM